MSDEDSAVIKLHNKTMKLPTMPDGLTPEWLTKLLRDQGHLDDGRIVEVHKEQVGSGTGLMSEIARLHLVFDGEVSGMPASLVAKYPSQNPTNRASAMSYNLYERETRYFAELDPLTSAHSPRIYFTGLEGDNFLILMEDMNGYRVGDQAAGADFADSAAMIDELAKLHSGFWDQVDDLDWVPHIANSYHADNMAALCEIGWPVMRKLFKDYLNPSIAAKGVAFLANLARLQEAMDAAPITLLHGDFRMENVFFGTRPEHHPIAVIDWQGPLRGKGVVDVALMLAQSTRTEVRRAHEKALIARYAEGLATGGVTDYPVERAWNDYQQALLYNWVYVSVVAGTLDVHNQTAFNWMSQMVARQSAASLDLDVFRLLN